MGRHSSHQQAPFLRSVVGWALPWVLGAVIAGTGVWVAVGALGSGQLDKPPRSAIASTETPPTARESPEPSRTSPGPKGRRRQPAPRRDGRAAKLMTQGLRVQVLNSTLVTGAARALAEDLEALGFDVVAVGDALRGLRNTTVFWSDESARVAAQRLAARFGWLTALRTATLSPDIDLHVVIGSDGG